MLGTRTKQVHSYGRRGSRIVNASNRRDRESADSSDLDTSPPSRPLKRENAIIISPTRPRMGVKGLKGSSCSLRSPPLVRNRNMQPKPSRDTVSGRVQYKLDSRTHVRQPLTPLRPNGTSSNQSPPVGPKGKSKQSRVKPTRTGLKPHSPVITVDILLFDDAGNVLTQERRLSHGETQVRTPTGERKKVSKIFPRSSSPIVISDDSDLEMVLPGRVAKRLNRKLGVIAIPSDESEADNGATIRERLPVTLARSRSRTKSLRVEVVIPPAPPRRSKIIVNPPSPSSLSLTPPRPPTLAVPIFRCGTAAVPSGLAPPITKPRQLTPIRSNSIRSLLRCLPPTPSTPTEADLSLDLAQLDLVDVTSIGAFGSAQPEYLVPLLNECAQTSPYEFSAFVETFPFDPIVQSSTEDENPKFRKIGEASYSEVFGIGNVVLKIIPVRFEEESIHPEIAEIPAPTDAKDVLKEIFVTREIGEICDKFIKLLKTYVVRGKYPSLLLDLWDEYSQKKGSESIRPDLFGLTQVYTIIILPNGGPDLESFVFKNASKFGWHQACSIFWQVARALEQAERLANFEHRDLHWGQILVKSIPVKKSTRKCSTSRLALDDTCFGVEITIIDLGLSRMDAADRQDSATYWTPFDGEIFEGEGDYQHDIYRMMKDLIGSAWKSYHPFTNVMWLHYLVTKLLREKRLKYPGGKRPAGGDTQMVSSTAYDEQRCYGCLAEMEGLLGSCIASARKRQKTRRKIVASSSGPRSARDVIAYGVQQGWLHR